MKLFLIAGEPSGDALGANLMAGLTALRSDVEFLGIGGPLMQAQGLRSLFPMSDLSVMGLTEVLPRLRHLFKRRDQAADAVISGQIDALITIDSPDFCLRVAKRVKQARPNMPVIHYVAPTVWAWRAGRARKMARHVDHVLALFPFEPPLMQAAGMGCDFVGHPVARAPQASAAECAAYRAGLGIGRDDPLLLLLPGSRRGEIARLGARFGAVARGYLAEHPAAHLVLPAAPAIADAVARMMADWDLGPRAHLLDPRVAGDDYARQKQAAFGAADVALAASGTVSLELAAAKTPMVIAYDMAPVSRMLMRWMLKIDTVTLVNLVSETRHIPEFLGKAFDPAAVMAALSRLTRDPEARAAQIAAADLTMARLGARLGAGDEGQARRAAEAVLRVLQ
ncbi:lipid-A-disaccharide synthase [Rhodobacteraceae bacterium XHP0102]|nr:lipid-A-disaccharide synthase [Rhodobacteraceae bacterium XHP0102]